MSDLFNDTSWVLKRDKGGVGGGARGGKMAEGEEQALAS